MVKQKKVDALARIKESIEQKQNLIFTDYRGLNVEQITDLRNELRKIGAEYTVIKNTFLRRVLKDLNINLGENDELLSGPTAVCMTDSNDIVAPCKVINDFSKDNENLSFKFAYLEGAACTFDTFKSLAGLPSKDQLIARVIGGIKQPITRIHQLITGPMRKIVLGIRAAAEKAQ